jgi:hypothetical protein
MSKAALPERIRRSASITAGGEYSWRQSQVEDDIGAAHEAGLACLGGQVQFRTRDGTFEAYWLKYDPEEQRTGELWQEFVARSAKEARERFRRLCHTTDFRVVARGWEVLRARMDQEGYDPVSDLWFVLYFVAENG